MCCILYCLSHPDFGLVLVSNRDEYLKRPAAPSQWHSFPLPSHYSTVGSPSTSIAHLADSYSNLTPSASHNVLSGLDAHPAGGGTWLGITRSGRLAAITNFTEAAPPPLPKGRGLDAYRSRGSLTKDWLSMKDASGNGDEDIEAYLHQVLSHIDEWPGFNLMAGQIKVSRDQKQTRTKIGYVSNRSDQEQVVYLEDAESDTSGGLSNSCWQEPWSKVKKGRVLLDEALEKYDEARKGGIDQSNAEEQLMTQLYDILESKVKILDRSNFVESIQIPPVRLAENNWYATRTATVLLVRRNGFARWWEKDVHVLSLQGEPIRGEALHLEPRYFQWTIEAKD